ncbi:MAG: hypothetical protein EP332_09620 [Bacteroidetes bacterium]|nr:MAG: hypothetical protein EP332_09620 [Bacteroidota bacterium]
MRKVIFIACLFAYMGSFGQGVQVGIGFNLGYANSNPIATDVYKTVGRMGLGIHTALKIPVNSNWAVYSGINFVRKSTGIRHQEFDFPELTSSGFFQTSMTSNLVQIPLQLSRKLFQNPKGYIELLAGAQFAVLTPFSMRGSSNWRGFTPGPDPITYYFRQDSIDFKTRRGIELTIGLAYMFKRRPQSTKTHRLFLGFERSLFKGPDIQYAITFQSTNLTKQYVVKESTQYWFLKLEYTYFFYANKGKSKELK